MTLKVQNGKMPLSLTADRSPCTMTISTIRFLTDLRPAFNAYLNRFSLLYLFPRVCNADQGILRFGTVQARRYYKDEDGVDDVVIVVVVL